MDDDAIKALRARIAQAERLACWISDAQFRSKLAEYAEELKKQLLEEGRDKDNWAPKGTD
jgi:hypothetical protein